MFRPGAFEIGLEMQYRIRFPFCEIQLFTPINHIYVDQNVFIG
jgi:hypothetical protein